MQPPVHPPDEAARLAALQALQLLDSLPEERFDRITRLARAFFGVPIVLVSLVDAERQWFKSKQGLDAPETPRDVSFCGHAILGCETFVVPDAHQDPRFADNPLVTGEPHVTFYAGHPIRNAEGHALGTLCLIDHRPRDFSAADRRALADYAALIEETLTTNAANAAKSAFLAGMSHELRTPLNAILGYSELLIEEAGEAGATDFVPDLEKIHGAGKHLLSLVDDVLDLAKIEAGKLGVVVEDVDLGALFGDLASMVRHTVERRGNHFDVAVPGELPPATTDGTKVKQIVLNLLSNAAKFTDHGRVVMAVGTDGDDLVVRVEDSGVGMTEEQLGRLFQPFEQAEEGTHRKHGGTGLGLALSRRLAHLLGGELSVTSAPGQGSAFTARIPMRYQPPSCRIGDR